MPLRHDELADYVSDRINSVVKSRYINQIIVGYSGGLDSTVLLHIIAELKDRIQSTSVLVIHVNHGVNRDSGYWTKHCQSFCDKHNLRLKISHYSLSHVKTNREAAYRQARYDAFSAESSENTLLLTAHHQRDQAETVLFNLFRGGGVSGLRGMKALKGFSSGYHLRPLLSVSHECISEYARHYNLPWIDDPSNQDQNFDRNYIRHNLLPVIEQRWPAAQASILRSAELLGKSEVILNEIAQQDIAHVKAKNSPGVIENLYLSVLCKKQFSSLSYQRKCNALMYWLKSYASIIVNSSQIDQIIQDLCAINKRSGLFQIENHQIRAYKSFIYLMPKLVLDPGTINQPQKIGKKTCFFKDLNLKLCFNKEIPENLEFKLREQGDRVQIGGQTRILKKLYQDYEIPPWERSILPLIYLDNKFITISGTTIHSNYECGISIVLE